MYEECAAELSMERSIIKDGYFDKEIHYLKVIRYDPELETLYLIAGKSELVDFSLDAIYRCSISYEGKHVICKGTIKERYWSKAGKVLLFRIQNGFYKK